MPHSSDDEPVFINRGPTEWPIVKKKTLGERFQAWRLTHPVAAWVLGIIAFLAIAWLIAADDGRDASELFTR